MIIYNISSYNRMDGLIKSIESVIDQCDVINVALNSYETIPAELYDKKIRIFITDNELGDAYKFLDLVNSNGYYFTIDDDIEYPADYTKFMVSNVNKYKRKSIITLHGRNYKTFPIDSFCYSVEKVHRFDRELSESVPVHIGGTGVMCFHTSLMKLPLSYFKKPNMADLWIAKYAKENNIKIICAKHAKHYIFPINIEGEKIWNNTLKDDSEQTNFVNSIFKDRG